MKEINTTTNMDINSRQE